MLSVIIATSESERPLVRTLAVLVPGASAGLVREVIVADGGSADGTAEVADVAGCRLMVSNDGPGRRLKAAAAAARASWLLFLKPGTVLDATWIDDVVRLMHDVGDGGARRAAVFRPLTSAASAHGMLMEALLLLRAALGFRPSGAQGLLIEKQQYEDIGGHRDHGDPETDLLRRLGRRTVITLRSGALVTPN
jgi:Glycosyl transferase family 2